MPRSIDADARCLLFSLLLLLLLLPGQTGESIVFRRCSKTTLSQRRFIARSIEPLYATPYSRDPSCCRLIRH